MKKFYFILFAILSGTGILSAQDCSDLFFSEYVEGTDNSKALEVYNPTDGIIDLSNYYIARYSNGALSYDAGGITQLQGFLQAKDVFILVNGQTEDLASSTKCDPALQAKADQLDHAYPSPTYMNGNDAIALLKDPVGDGNEADFVPVDLFGTIGGGMTADDEGWTNFTDAYAYKNIYDLNDEIVGKDSVMIHNYIVPSDYYWLAWTANHTLIRKPEVKKGITVNPEAFNVTIEWDTLSSQVNDWSNLGVHDCQCAENTTSVSQLVKKPEVQLFPNPVTNGFFVLSANKPVLGYTITNSAGQIIRNHSARLNQLSTKIYINDDTTGMLLIRIKFSDTEYKTEKVFVR